MNRRNMMHSLDVDKQTCIWCQQTQRAGGEEDLHLASRLDFKIIKHYYNRLPIHTTADEKAEVLLIEQWNEMWLAVGTSRHQLYYKSIG